MTRKLKQWFWVTSFKNLLFTLATLFFFLERNNLSFEIDVSGNAFRRFATTLLFVFVTLHYCRDAHKQIHHWFLWRKSAQDTDSFENGNSVQKKEMKPKQWYLFHWKYSQNQQKCCTCLTMWIFLKSTPVVFKGKNILLFMVHSRLQR